MSLRTWWESRAESPSDYTSLRIADATARVSGKPGVQGSAAYISARNLIADSVSIAEVSGEFSESLKPLLPAIATGLVDCGESVFEIQLSGDGKLSLLPATIASVSGGADPSEWDYLLTRQGPSESTSIQRPAAAVLAFTAHVDPKRPWRGRGAISASGTGALLAELEAQLLLESKVKPTRLITAGSVKLQGGDVEASIQRGGIVSVLQAFATAVSTDPSGLKAGTIKNESTASVVSLHQNLSAQIASALGVPPDLLGSTASEAGTRESFRRFAASTINALLEIIQVEWQAKIGALAISMLALKAGDIAARSRAVGSRANAFKNLVSGGVGVERALSLSGLNDT